MQFKDLGELFNSFDEISGKRFKDVTSIDDMLGWQKSSFNEFLKLDSSGISKYTMEEIKAKSAVLGLTDELTAQAVALAKDADFSAKAATGKLTYGKAIIDNIDDIDKIADALEKSGKIPEQQAKILSTLTKGSDEYNQYIKNIINGTDDIADSVIDIGTSVQSSSTALSTYFKGILATIKPLVPAITAVAVAFAAFKAWDYSQHGFTRAQKEAENASSEYENVKSNLQSLNSELDTTKSKIQELEALQDNGTITLAQEAELENLKETNNELERQVAIQESLLKIKQDASAQAALNASKQQQTYTEAMEEEYGGFWGKIYGFLTDNGGTYVSNMTGEVVKTGSKAEEWYEKYGNDSTISGQAKANIKALEEYKQQLVDIEKQLKDNPEDKDLIKTQDELKTKIESTTTALSDQSSTLQEWINQSTDSNGVIIKGYESSVEEWRSVLTMIQNVGKSQKEIDLNNLNNYFSSSKGKVMKNYLDAIIESGGNANDVLNAFQETGMRLDDIGVSAEGFIDYFKQISDSADEASNAIEGFDGSLESITKAGESENQDNNWNVTAALLKKAKDLDNSKKWGTDDFQSMAQFIAPEGSIINTKNSNLKATDYKDLWDKYYANFKKYFDEDNPLQSAINAQDKLISSGLGTMGNDGIVTWTENFKSSADAAKAWGISVEAAEIAMHNLESYGAEFDDVVFSKEKLNEYKSSLDGIKSIYDSMEDGAQKDRLGKLIESYTSEYDKFNQDLSTLTSDEQIVRIRFEYNLASIQDEIDKVRAQIEAGDSSSENFASVIAGNDTYIKKQKELLNFDKIEVPVEIQASEKSIEETRKKMRTATGDEKIQLQAELSNKQEVEKSLLNAFNDAHPEITPDTDPSVVQEKLTEFFSQPQHITVDADIVSEGGTKSIEEELQTLAAGSTITFSADIDGVERDVSAVKNEDGSIVYTANVDGVEVPVEVSEKDGTVTFHVDDTDVKNYTPEQKKALVKYYGDTSSLPTSFTPVYRQVLYTENGGAAESKLAWKKVTGKSEGTITPALALGSAYNVINTKPLSAFAKGNISLPQDEVALVNELGTEGLIRDGKLMAIPGGIHMQALKKGDIILSVAQMKALYATGKASGHARSYANGTILSSAYGNAMPSLGGSYGKSYSNSSTSKSSTSKNTNTSKNKDSSNSDTEKKFEETLDLVKIYLERQERRTEKLVNAIDDAVGLVDKQAATNKAISQVQAEIQANQKAYNTYKQKADAVGLSSDYKNKIINGQLSIETITDESLNDSIQEFQQWYDEMLGCEDKIDDLKDKLKDLAQTKFDNVTTEFENQISLIEHETKMLESTIDLIESQGYIVTRDYYDNLIKQEEENYNKLQSEYKTLTDTLNDLLNQKLIEKYSDQWYDMTNSINEVSEAILDSQKALVEYENAIRDLEWDFFDKTQDMLSQIQAESDFLVELMSNDKMYDSETGKITEKGQATLGLHAVNYNAYMSQADDYAKEIAKIDKELADDPNNQTLLERRQELLETQRDMIKSAEDEKQAIKDLVSDGYDAFLEVMQKAIDKRKELLTNIKDMYDYEKNIAEQTKEISALEKQLNAYQGDTSEEAKSTIQQLKVSLEEAKKNLEETEYDKYISDQEQMLDSLYSETEEWINGRLDNLELIIQNVIDSTNENSESIKETLTNEAESVGITLSDAMNSIWSPDGTYTSVVTTYGDNFSSLLTTTNSTLATIRKYVAKMAGITESEENTSKPSTPKPSTPNTDNSSNNSTNNNTSSSSSGKWGSWFISKKDSYPKNKLDKDKSIVDRLRYFDYDFSMSARARYYKAMGKTDTYTGSASQNQWMLSEMKKNGFKKGGTIGSLIKRTGEDGYVLARTGEEILSLDKINALKDSFITMDSMFKNLIKLPEMPQSQVNNGNVTNEITFHFELPNVRNADDFVNALKNDKRCEKIIQQMTLGAMTGKNSLLKYNY